MTFNSDTIRLMRVFKGLTQEDLGKRVSASVATISQIEKGRAPSETLGEALAVVLGVDRNFFSQKIDEEFVDKDCNFRQGNRSVERVRRQVLAQGTLFSHAVAQLKVQHRVELPPYNVPYIPATTLDEIELAAETCRTMWGLGIDTPISLMSRVIETKAGVMLTRLKKDSAVLLDAFSRRARNGGVSYIVLNPAKGSATRTRFDMTHELGHLVLHSDDCVTPLKQREEEANNFASAFLLPRVGFRREFRTRAGRVHWPGVFELKARWKVSAAAIVFRAYRLNLIDAVEFRRAYKILSARGWLKQEPEEPASESPELFQTVISKLWSGRRIGVDSLAISLHWSVPTFQEITGLHSRANEDPSTVSDGIIRLADRRKTETPSQEVLQA